MTTNKDRADVSGNYDGLVAGQWDDYANISHLTDKDHRLPDWILGTISGQKRSTYRDATMLKGQAFGYVREFRSKRAQNEKIDVKSSWRFLIICYEIGLRQVIREYEDQLATNSVEEGDKPA